MYVLIDCIVLYIMNTMGRYLRSAAFVSTTSMYYVLSDTKAAEFEKASSLS